MEESKSYTIGSRRFEQRRLVWGQFLQLRQLFLEIRGAVAGEIALEGGLIDLLGHRMPAFAAVVLREPGRPVAGKDLAELTAFLEDNLDAQSAEAVVTDFLSCTPIASDFSALMKLFRTIGGLLPAAKTTETESSSSSACSPEGTSPEGKPSCGDADPTTASPTCGTASGS